MHVVALDTISRRAANVSRRSSLLTLSGAGLAAVLGGPLTATAKKSGKSRKKALKKCKPQVAQCAAVVQTLCDEFETDPEVCKATIACCELLGRCNAGGFLACMSAA